MIKSALLGIGLVAAVTITAAAQSYYPYNYSGYSYSPYGYPAYGYAPGYAWGYGWPYYYPAPAYRAAPAYSDPTSGGVHIRTMPGQRRVRMAVIEGKRKAAAVER